MLEGGGEFFVAGAFSLLNGRFLDGCLRPFLGYFLYKTVSSGLILADVQRFRVVNSLSKHVSSP